MSSFSPRNVVTNFLTDIRDRVLEYRVKARPQASMIGKIQLLGRRGEKAPFSFKTANDIYKEVGLVTAAVDGTIEMFTGGGYHTSFEEEEESKLFVDQFGEDHNVDDEVITGVRDAAITGNAWWEKILHNLNRPWSPNTNPIIGFKRIDPLTMERSIRLKPVPGKPNIFYPIIDKYVQIINGIVAYEFRPDQIIHYKWKTIPGSRYGMGMVEPIIDYVTHLDDAMTDMGLAIKKYAWLVIAWMLENADETTYNDVKGILDNLKPGESPIIATKGETKVKAEQIQMEARARFEFFFNLIMNLATVGLQCPTTILFRSEVRVSDASATALDDSFNRKIGMKQRSLKRLLENDLFRCLIEQERLTEIPRLNWGEQEEPELEMEDIVKFAEIGATTGQWIIKIEEIRNLLRQRGIELLEEVTEEEPEEIALPETPPEEWTHKQMRAMLQRVVKNANRPVSRLQRNKRRKTRRRI